MDAATVNTVLQEALLYTTVAAAATQLKKRRKKCWCRKWICRRSERGNFTQILENNALMALRTTAECLWIHSMICSPRLNFIPVKEDTSLCESFAPGARLEVAFRCLVTSFPRLGCVTTPSNASHRSLLPHLCSNNYFTIYWSWPLLYLHFPACPGKVYTGL